MMNQKNYITGEIMRKTYLVFIFIILIPGILLSEIRLKDITDIEGGADLQIIGYGLVVGLNKTGDGTKSVFTIQSIVNMLERFGLNVDAKQIKPKNVAAVMVTADLSPYIKKGARIDVSVSSISDATSLEGGMLLITPMSGTDGNVYVQAQGPVSIGGMNASAEGGGEVSINHALVGRIPGGGIIMRENPAMPELDGRISFLLRDPDFTTASRIAGALNQEYSMSLAYVLDAGTIEAIVPYELTQSSIMEFIARAENVTIEPDVPARVVVNERTGTVVVGENVRLSSVAVSHGNLSITITPRTTVSQPGPLSGGETVTTQSSQIKVESASARLMVMNETPDVGSVARALNSLGVTPRDIIAIFQALKQSGALQAELIII